MSAPTVAASTSGPSFAAGNGRRKAKDNTATALVYSAFIVALIPLIWLLWTVVNRGYHGLFTSSWWTTDQRGITFRRDGGGMLHALVGTLEQVALCTVISVPIAVLVAVYLVEYASSRLSRVATFMVDILTGIPSIVAAMFVYAALITTGIVDKRAGWLVSLALVLLMIPVIVRTTEEMLKLVPNELREASYALGVPKWKTIIKIVLPTAFTGIITGIILGIARVAGETAPLIVLVGYTKETNYNLFEAFQGSLPGMILDQATNLGNKRYHFAADRLWGAALTLILLVMILNLIARLVARRSKISN